MSDFWFYLMCSPFMRGWFSKLGAWGMISTPFMFILFIFIRGSFLGHVLAYAFQIFMFFVYADIYLMANDRWEEELCKRYELKSGMNIYKITRSDLKNLEKKVRK